MIEREDHSSVHHSSVHFTGAISGDLHWKCATTSRISFLLAGARKKLKMLCIIIIAICLLMFGYYSREHHHLSFAILVSVENIKVRWHWQAAIL
jgi:hypothetical protein